MRGSWQKQAMEVEGAEGSRKQWMVEGITRTLKTARFMACVVLTVMVAALMVGVPMAVAQSSSGQIKGVVTDPSGAVIPGAAVTAISLDNGFTRTVNSGRDGSFLIPQLDPQHYKVQVVAPGFETLERGPITVQVTETADIGRIPLTVGAQTETVSVKASEELLDTENATLGKVYDAKLIEGLPLSTRNFTQLIGLQAGVIGAIPDTLTFGNGTTQFAVGGNRVYDNSINIDGVNALSSSGNGSFSIPSPDSLEEFKVQTSNYSAEYGRAGGASVDVTTKSGTNHFHGDGFYFFRNKALDANGYFTKQSQALLGEPNVPYDLRQNQWGATVGGPIVRNKLTFFFSFQSTNQIDGNAGAFVDDTYPLIPAGDRSNSAAFQQALGAIYGGEPGTNGVTFANDGSNLNPVTLALLQAKFPDGQYVLPSFPKRDILNTGRTDISYAAFNSSPTYKEKQYMGNVDYKLTANQTLSEKFFTAHSDTEQQNGSIPGFFVGAPLYNQNANVTHTWIISPSLVNAAKVGYLHQYQNSANNNQGFTATEIGMKQVPDADGAFPLLLIAQDGILMAGSTAVQSSDENQYSISDVVSKTLSHHNLRIGGIVMKHQYGLKFQDAGAIFVLEMADLLIGNEGNIFLTANSAGDFNKNFRFNDYGYFIQDDYKALPNLTFNLGLRWDYFQQPMEVNGLMDNFLTDKVAEGRFGIPTPDQGYTGYAISSRYLKLHPNFVIPNGITVLSERDGLTPNYFNYAPRVGFAWQAEPNLSIRGGFGLFFDRVSAAVAASGLIGAPFNNRPLAIFPATATLQDPFTSLGLLPDSSYPIWTPRVYTEGSAAGVSLNAAATNVGNPYTEQWNLNIQQQFGKDYLFELAYQGSNGVKLLEGLAKNQSGLASPQNPIRGITTNLAEGADQGKNIADRVPYAGIGTDEQLSITGTSASSHFNALEATVNKRFSHGFQFLSAFTWSRNEDSDTVGTGGVGSGATPTNDNNSTHHMSISGNDRALRFTTSAVYTLPNPIKNPHTFGQASINHVLGGWGLAGTMVAQTGGPISFQIPASTVQSSAIITQGGLTASLAPGASLQSIEGHGAASTRLSNYFNTVGVGNTPSTYCQALGSPSKLACPAATAFGNLPTFTSLRAPGQKTVDLALTKTTRIFADYNIEFRADFFNAFNWTNFAGPDAGITDPTFGLINGTTVEPRVIQVSAKFKF
jgi:outer membrane receptor protein involved in Fe transport